MLLRDTLARSGKAGLARVVIRSREYLALVLSEGEALLLLLLRFHQELVAADEYRFPAKRSRGFRIVPREREMAEQLVESMTVEWQPEKHRDQFRERLHKVVQARVRQKGSRKKVSAEAPADRLPDDTSTNVVDFMALLKKSLAENKRTPTKSRPAAPRRRHQA